MNQNKKALPMWEWWSARGRGRPVYDNWLDAYAHDLEKAGERDILDLGCGAGADTQYLIDRGFRVLSADYAKSALRSVEKNIPGSKTKYVDMNGAFPFADGQFPVIVADISLHYFDTASTIRVMKEIRRILAPGGVLLARVSSINDTAFGAGYGRELEPRYYDHGGYAQRYMDESDVERFFEIVGKASFREAAMTRAEAYYSTPKMLYEVRVEK